MPIEEIMTKKAVCKNCSSEVVVKFSSYKGVPRNWCKVCKRRFKGDNEVLHMKVPAEYFKQGSR